MLSIASAMRSTLAVRTAHHALAAVATRGLHASAFRLSDKLFVVRALTSVDCFLASLVPDLLLALLNCYSGSWESRRA